MLKRDFNKSNKEYLNKNKVTLISFGVFILVGILILAIFGMNGNFEIKGYYEFSINVTAETDYSEYSKTIKEVVNEYGADFDTTSIFDEGDNTQIVVRYMNSLSEEDKTKLENDLASKLVIEIDDINEHYFVKATVTKTDYIYTATAILLLVALASVFAYFRYNGASAITILLTCTLGTLGFISLGSILRLTIGKSYFAMLVILNMLLVYLACDIFETIRSESWLGSKEYEKALDSAMHTSRTRQLFITISVMAIGMLLVLFATSPLKYVSLNVLFMAVVLLACAWYVIPFVWNVFITLCKIKEYKVKATNVEDLEDNNK